MRNVDVGRENVVEGVLCAAELFGVGLVGSRYSRGVRGLSVEPAVELMNDNVLQTRELRKHFGGSSDYETKTLNAICF